ncbi:Protein msta_ isoform Alike [Caligus rogercresseyi]|uniref:Protein msta_ isoform Alike n=1 Tax=Caligus rogercresseyi TaxID=217165 RepID=A0A7T8JX09_CALRO|nr:Protein msta_ isoform Alike [Caligus rogercresseyi]
MDIKRGEELTTNYLHYHYHFFGSTYRLKDCASHWHFRCSCKRCSDTTEFGTQVDAIVCQDCAKVHGLDGAGNLLPMSSTEPNSDWVCNKCFSTLSAYAVQELLDEWWDSVDNVPKYNIPSLERKHHELKNYFAPSHYYVMEIKRRLIVGIGEAKGYDDIQSVARPWLQKKVEYCREHLELQKVLAPGYSEYRAYISFHLAEALFHLTKKDKKQESIDLSTAITRMEEVADHLLLVINVWGKFRLRSDEQKVAGCARRLLERVDESYLHRNYAMRLDDGSLWNHGQMM